MTIQYTALGRTEGIGASAHYLRLGDWGILLDAGLDPGHAEVLPDFERIGDQPLNAIVISHAHLDHLGSLPVALRYFPQARVYMTPGTAALSEKMLFHYIRVRRRRAMEEMINFDPLYTEQEVEQLLYLFQSFDYGRTFNIHGFQESDIELTFWDAGNILGSAGVEINWRSQKIFFTGNTKKSSQFILKGARYPGHTDVLITESTYGADEQAPNINRQAELKRFASFLRDRLKLGGSVLLPVFALGRTQEIMVLLHRLIQKNRIPAVPIYITGFGVEINKVYDRLLRKTYPHYAAVRLRAISFNTLRGKRIGQPSIILATSGMMLANTLSYEIAGSFLTQRRNAIGFVNWADPETPAGALREKKADKIRKVFAVSDILCEVEIFRFSAHSHRLELLSLVNRLSPVKTVLCHGEPQAMYWLKNQILERGFSKEVLIPEQGKYLHLT